MAEYNSADHGSFTPDSLREAQPDVQHDVMEAWFRDRFEDPANRTPYESAEGGYIWIWGGPYDAREELESEFSGFVPDEIIGELIDELEGECYEWAPTPRTEDYDEYVAEDIAEISEYRRNFSFAIEDIQRLLKTEVDPTSAQCLWRLLYVNVITALETYLSDAFINTVLNRPTLMRRFIETCPSFQGEKIPLSEIFKAQEQIERKARSYLVDLVWHRLDCVREMYQTTLGIGFPSDIGVVHRAVVVRHDLVHRNGKTKKGEEITMTPKEITDLITEVEKIVESLDEKLSEVRRGIDEPLKLPESTDF